MNADDFPVDMVYLWCQGQDPEFARRKNFYLRQEKHTTDYESGDQRFFDNDELKYSLRSLAQNASWIHHVFIVTDRQIPSWLDLDHEKVTITDQSQIMPSGSIPCFNAGVIERYIFRIPGLEEHFLYGNDDTFFGKPVGRDFFFVSSGQPIIRVWRRFIKEPSFTREKLEAWLTNPRRGYKQFLRTWKLLADHNHWTEFYIYNDYHNIDAYTKTIYNAVYEKYEDRFRQDITRFRSEYNIERILFSMEAVYNGGACLKVLPLNSRKQKLKFLLTQTEADGYYATERAKSLWLLKLMHPKMFCINDEGISNGADKKRVRKFMDSLFPQPASWEKSNGCL